ncbi:MAG: UDP-N-acetylglucosamine--N-acetylmuramyl-(pentapeptide) pyrophosphoryl-undecaprenol N-acetylglucosamine transferase [Anaerohalosphaeraceae bacterium]
MNSGQIQHIFFAGGGTGGHLYPALAVAERIQEQYPNTEITFFCSPREVDAKILSPSRFNFLPLPAVGLSKSPLQAIRFFGQFLKSYYFTKEILRPVRSEAAVVGTGGFVCAPAAAAARSLHIPIFLINVDSVPGKSNRLTARFARRIFVQFEQTRNCFGRFSERVDVVGCPLRKDFFAPPENIHKAYDLDPNKKILLITGASSGSMSINQAVLEILPSLERFAADWQVVHLTGMAHYQWVRTQAGNPAVLYRAIDYCHQMPALLKASSLVVGRAGAVSIAEYATAGVPAVCLPYPYHKDRHQFLNAKPLADAGGAIIIEDDIRQPSRTRQALSQTLTDLMSSPQKLARMAAAAKTLGRTDAAERIVRCLFE